GLWLAVGIGLNLAWAPDDAERPAAALADHLAPDVVTPTTEAALSMLDAAMGARLDQWRDQGAASILADWTACAPGVPGPCTARLGQETLYGQAEGLDPDGALRLRLPDGTLRRVTAGDVFFGESP